MPRFPPEHPSAATVRTPAASADPAGALVDVIREAPGGIVVVIGARRSGKTEFIREEAVPRLRAAWPAVVFDCAAGVGADVFAAVAEPGVVILDSFDRFLRLPQAARDPVLEALLAPRHPATLVLVSDKECLASLLELRKHAPGILDHLFELEELTLANELSRFRPPDGDPVEWGGSALEELETDLARFSDSTVTPALVSIIYRGFQEHAYDPKRRLVGLLERYLEGSLTRIAREPGFVESDADVARALLKGIATDGKDLTSLPGEIARRLDVADDVALRCQQWLIERSGLLRDSAADGLVFQPPQLRPVLQMAVEEDHVACARAKRYAAEGLDARLKIGALLTPERFQEIHAQRLLLCTTPDEAAFLARCALQIHPAKDPGPVGYWFRRIGDSTLELSTLVEALADPSPKTRARAASMLRLVDEPRVHGHLCRLALEDDAPDVRQQAIESLARFASQGPIRDVLVDAAQHGSLDTRVRAIEALRIFADEACARFLQTIVASANELAVRDAAIQALARTQSRTGTLALVRIALDDPDHEDRDRARVTLSRLDSPELTDAGLNAALDDWAARRPAGNGRWWKKFGHWPAVVAILVGGLFVHGLPVLFFRRRLAGGSFFAVQAAATLLATRWNWLYAVVLVNYCVSIAVAAWVARRTETVPGSFRRALSNALLANTVVTAGLALHGLGHWITGRRRQAWQLMALETLAVIAILPTFYLDNLFNIAIVRDRFDSLTVLLLRAYRFGFAISWVWSVSSLAVAERWGRKGPWLSERHAAALRALLNSPVSAAVLRGRLLAGEPQGGRARMLLERFGDAVSGDALLAVVAADLEARRSPAPEFIKCLARFKSRRGYERVVTNAGELFDRLPAEERAPLFRLLATHPTDTSVRSLWERRGRLRAGERVRRFWAAVVLPFRDWHWTVWLAAAAGAVLAMLLIVDAVRTSVNPGWPEIKELRRLSRHAGASADVGTVAEFLAKRHPMESIAELATLLKDVENGSIAEEHGSGIAASLGLVATFQVPPIPVLETLDAAAAARRAARAAAVDALVSAALNSKNDRLRSDALQALQQAAERKGSPELVAGLATLFDAATATHDDTALPSVVGQEHARRRDSLRVVSAMLGSVAQPVNGGEPGPAQLEARKVIAARAEKLGELLLTSSDVNFKQSALGALQASADDAAVRVIQNVVLSDRTPVQTEQFDKGARPNAQRVRAADELARQQQSARAMAVDALRAMKTPTAIAALLQLSDMPNLAEEIAVKVKKVAAQELNDEARRALTAGRLDDALQQARRAVAADGTFADAHATLGEVLYQRLELDEALKEFRAATAGGRGAASAYYMQAMILGSLQDYTAADRAVTSAIRTDPAYPLSYRLLADLYHRQGRDIDAAARLRALQSAHPEVAEIYVQLAFVYHERLADHDAANYDLAYEANARLLRLIGDGDPVQVLAAEMNLLECRLTVGRYREVLEKAPDLLTRVGDDADNRLALRVLMMAAQVLSRDDRGALQTLADVRRIYNEDFKSTGKWHGWLYDGTLQYVRKHAAADARVTALAELIEAINNTSSFRERSGPAPAVAGEVFERLTAVLAARRNSAPVP